MSLPLQLVFPGPGAAKLYTRVSHLEPGVSRHGRAVDLAEDLDVEAFDDGHLRRAGNLESML
jgi:hypothetical protein